MRVRRGARASDMLSDGDEFEDSGNDDFDGAGSFCDNPKFPPASRKKCGVAVSLSVSGSALTGLPAAC